MTEKSDSRKELVAEEEMQERLEEQPGFQGDENKEEYGIVWKKEGSKNSSK